jgi:hypothetical protein
MRQLGWKPEGYGDRVIACMPFWESLQSEVREAVRGRGHFPSDEAATKLSGRRCVTSLRSGRIHPLSGMPRKPGSRYRSQTPS